jgi:hypothetical protein
MKYLKLLTIVCAWLITVALAVTIAKYLRFANSCKIEVVDFYCPDSVDSKDLLEFHEALCKRFPDQKMLVSCDTKFKIVVISDVNQNDVKSEDLFAIKVFVDVYMDEFCGLRKTGP